MNDIKDTDILPHAFYEDELIENRVRITELWGAIGFLLRNSRFSLTSIGNEGGFKKINENASALLDMAEKWGKQ